MEPASGPTVTVAAAVAALEALGVDNAASAPRRRSPRRACTRPGTARGTRGVVGDRRRAGVRRVRRRRHAGHVDKPRRHRLAWSHRRAAARRAEHDPRRQRALPRRSAHAARGLVRPRPSLERARCGPVRRGRAARAGRARAPATARPHAGTRPHRYRARETAELARHHAAQLAASGECRHRGARVRRPGHHPGWGAGHADPRLLEHPVRRAARRSRRTLPRSSATCSSGSPARRRRHPCATTTTSATWWSAHGARTARSTAAPSGAPRSRSACSTRTRTP